MTLPKPVQSRKKDASREDRFAAVNLDYELWTAGLAVAASRRELSKYRDALDMADKLRLDLDKKNLNLKSAYEKQLQNLQCELDREQQGKLEYEKKITSYLDRLDEESFRNDVLQFQLEQSYCQVKEHQAHIKAITEKLQELEYTVKRLESESTEKDNGTAMFIPRTCVIDQLEHTCSLLEQKLRESHKDKEFEVAEISATISNQLEMIESLHGDVAEQQWIREQEKATTVCEQEAVTLEIERLKSFIENSENQLKRIKAEHESLQGNVDMLIEMNADSETTAIEYAETNKRLQSHVAVLNRELELIKGLLKDRFPTLDPNLGNLPNLLKNQRRSNKRKGRN